MKTLVLIAALLAVTSHARGEENPERPNMQAGKLFTVHVVPNAQKLEIKVAGNGVAEAEMTKLGLFAKIKVGDKDIVLTPVKRSATSYVIDRPSGGDTGKLHIKVEAGKKQEQFDFEVPAPK